MDKAKHFAIHEDENFRAAVSYYAPHMEMSAHAHDCHQFSFLLAGSLAEETPHASQTNLVPSRGIKSAGQIHANRYGPKGALIFAINVRRTAAEPLPGQPKWQWEPLSRRGGKTPHASPPPLLHLWEASDQERIDIIWDLIAHQFAGDDEAPEDACPKWLTRVEEELHAAPESADLGRIAAAYGIHRGHLSRAFKRRYGLSPSQYRSRSQVMQGLSRMLAGARPAEAAQSAGFADQSHFTRMADRYLGLTPGRIQMFLQAAS